MLVAAARMGERAREQGRVPRAVAEGGFDPGGDVGGGAQNVSPIRFQRAALIQVQGFSHSAVPSVEKKVISASPIR